MIKLNELIDKLCPNGVEYREIGAIANYRRGSFPQPYTNSSYYGGDESMPFVQVADIEESGFKLKKETRQTISKIAQPKSIFVPKGTVICSIQGSIGKVAITQYDSYVDRTIAIFESYNVEINKRYFAYCIQYKFGIEKQFARGSTLKTITKDEFSKFLIPIPPMDIQKEIVKILDTFSTLLMKLNEEYDLRNKQYEYCMQKLFNFGEEIKYKEINECCKVEKGKTQLSKAVSGQYPLVATTEELQSSNEYQFDDDAVCVPLISARGHGVASITRIYYQSGKFALGNILCAVIPNDKNELSAEFLRHYLYYKKDVLLVPLMRGGANVALTTDSLKTVKIPIPPMDIQKEIVSKINKVYEIIDKKIGILKEIEKREQQYEYYRDILLTFKEAK